MVQGLSSVDEFLEKLPDFDGEIESQRKDAEASGEVSRMNPWNDDSISLSLPRVNSATWTLHIRCTALFISYIANLRMSLFQVYFHP